MSKINIHETTVSSLYDRYVRVIKSFYQINMSMEEIIKNIQFQDKHFPGVKEWKNMYKKRVHKKKKTWKTFQGHNEWQICVQELPVVLKDKHFL